jgi:hypothetical protein
MSLRRVTLVSAVALAGVLTVAGCSSSDSSSSSTTTSGGATTTESVIGGDVTTPVVLSASAPTTTVKVGQVVTFDMGDPNGGTFVATSDKPAVFEIIGEGRTEGSATFNAGGRAVGTGVAEVVVQFHGSTNGLGTPTTFTITVE